MKCCTLCLASSRGCNAFTFLQGASACLEEEGSEEGEGFLEEESYEEESYDVLSPEINPLTGSSKNRLLLSKTSMTVLKPSRQIKNAFSFRASPK